MIQIWKDACRFWHTRDCKSCSGVCCFEQGIPTPDRTALLLLAALTTDERKEAIRQFMGKFSAAAKPHNASTIMTAICKQVKVSTSLQSMQPCMHWYHCIYMHLTNMSLVQITPATMPQLEGHYHAAASNK